MAVNQALSVLKPKCEFIYRANGNAFLRINKSSFHQMPLTVPPSAVTEAFRSLAANHYNGSVENERITWILTS